MKKMKSGSEVPNWEDEDEFYWWLRRLMFELLTNNPRMAMQLDYSAGFMKTFMDEIRLSIKNDYGKGE